MMIRFLNKVQAHEKLRHCCSSAKINQDFSGALRYFSDVSHSSSKRSYAERFPSLVHPLPGLKLPPSLPDYQEEHLTKITVLPNGLKVASEDAVGPAACVGIFVNSGSVYESEELGGVSHLLERLAFKDTRHRSHQQIVREVEAIGGNAGCAASREQMAYSYDTLKAYLPQAVELLIDCVRNPIFLQSEVKEHLANVQEEIGNIHKEPQKFLLEALHLAGYSGALGSPLVAPEGIIGNIDRSDIEKFYFDNYTADRIVLAASGVPHQCLLELAEPLLHDWQKGLAIELPSSTYVGGDFRHSAESDLTHVALAFEVPGGWHHARDATILTVLQTLMGGGGSFSAGGPGKGMHSRLYLRVLNKHREMQSISAFSSVYDDSGLFGIQLSTTADFVRKAVDIATIELLTIATPGEVTELELLRAKNGTKSAILTNLESRCAVMEDVGRQILTYGCRKPVKYFMDIIDEITLDDIRDLADRILDTPLTMACSGDVDSMPSYESICVRF